MADVLDKRDAERWLAGIRHEVERGNITGAVTLVNGIATEGALKALDGAINKPGSAVSKDELRYIRKCYEREGGGS